MRLSFSSLSLALLFIAFTTCGSPPEVADVEEYTPPPVIKRIAGYDVSHLEVTSDDLQLAYQKMTPAHVLQLAAIYCDSTLLTQTLGDGIDPNTLFWENHLLPEVAACPDNGLLLTRLMIEAGANVNGSDEYNDNALSFAIAGNNTSLVDFLLKQGADLEQRDTDEEYGCLPIHAVKEPKMLAYLLERGATLDNTCTSGRTLLHFAAEEDNADLIRYILENDLVDPEATDQYGETAYYYATASASSEAQTLLHP